MTPLPPVSARGMGYFDKRGLIKAQLQEAGYSKVTSAILARVMGKYGGVTWHPMTRADQKLNQSLVDFYKKMRAKQANYSKKGADIAFADNTTPEDTKGTPADKAAAKTNADAAHQAVSETSAAAKDAGASLKAGDATTFEKFKASTSLKITSLGAGALGVVCIVKGINDKADEIKYTQVILPLIRQGAQAIALGNQIMSGQEVDLDQLRFYDQQFSGKDSSNTQSSWADSRSIQAEMGQPQTGPQPNKALSSIS